MALPSPSTVPADVRLKRFLHFGREIPVYITGYHDFHEFMEMKNLNAIEELLANSPEERQTEIVNHIIKAAMDGYVVYPNCLAFALAVCARQKTSEKLRHAAYAALATVCKTPKDLFEFVNFASKLTTRSKGWGAGIRTAISNWYLKRDSMELAEFVTKQRGFMNWTHRDLLKLVHPKSEEPEKAVILKYILLGLEEAKTDAPKDEKTVKVLEYLQQIEEFKHLTAPQQAANLISVHGYSYDLVPQHNGLIKSHEVWMSLVRTMPLNDLLENVKRLSCYGFLKANEPMEKVIIERLQDEAAITESNLHPFAVFVQLRKYEEHAKDQVEKMNGLVKSGRLTKVIKPAAKPNQKIIAALNSLLSATFKLLVPTGMRYLLAIDLTMKSTDKVVGAPFVSPLQASVLLAMALLKADKNVKVVTFPALEENDVGAAGADGEHADVVPEVMLPLDIDCDISLQANLDKLKEVKCGPGNIKQPFLWAKKEKVAADVIIVVSSSCLGHDYIDTVRDYRQAMNLPNAKFIEHYMSAMLFRSEDNDAGVFHISGFGGQVGKVVEAFSRGAF